MEAINTMEMVSVAFDKTAYDTEYQKRKTTLFTVRLNNTHDADILGWLSEQSNKQGYIKALIRADMERNKP